MTNMRLDEVAHDALSKLDLAGDSDEDRRAAITVAEPIVLAAIAETRWDLVFDLAVALADAYADDSEGDSRRREWADVAVSAARSLEGDDGGPSTIAALDRLGRAQLDAARDTTDLESAHTTYLQAVEVAERVYGPEGEPLIDLLLCAGTGAAPDFAVDLATRALDLAEQHERPLLPVLLEVTSAMIEAERAEDAVPYAMRAVELAEQDEDEDDAAPHGLLAQALLDSGRPVEAREVIDRVPVDDEPWLSELKTRILASLEQVTRSRSRPLETRRR